MPRHPHAPTRLLTALAALMIPACGGGDGEYHFAVHPADGRVVAKGKPVPRAIVRLHPVDPETIKVPDGRKGPPLVLTTETDADGKFSLSSYVADDGVPAGDYKVTVAVGLPESDLENSDGKARPAPRTSPVPKAYRDPATTPLKATVKPGENHFDFEVD